MTDISRTQAWLESLRPKTLPLAFAAIVVGTTLAWWQGHFDPLVAGLALILGIDRFMSEARALTNLVGNGVATIVVAKWVKELDAKQLDDVLNNRTPVSKSHELSS